MLTACNSDHVAGFRGRRLHHLIAGLLHSPHTPPKPTASDPGGSATSFPRIYAPHANLRWAASGYQTGTQSGFGLHGAFCVTPTLVQLRPQVWSAERRSQGRHAFRQAKVTRSSTRALPPAACNQCLRPNVAGVDARYPQSNGSNA